MDVVHHPTNNFLLGPPNDGSMPDCKTIPATLLVEAGQPQVIVTYWEPSPEEVHAIRNGGKIKLFTWGGFPPTAMQVEGAEHADRLQNRG